MRRKAARVRLAPRLEPLEDRRLMSTGQGAVDPATSLLVAFRAGISPSAQASVLRAFNAQVVTSFPSGPVLVSTPTVAARDYALKTLPRLLSVRYAEPNYSLHVDAAPPNDPAFANQWGLNNTLNNVDIDAPEAWLTTQGSSATIVAVIDSGIDLSHPDFAGRVWTNVAEANGVPGADDDGNGYADDVHGWNFITNTADINDDNGHGTHVAGILGATGNNGTGVAGVNWNARIMPLKFIGADGNGSVEDAIRAIYYAVQNGARVINASWGGGQHIQALTDAIAYANANNVVFVTAAGNESVNNAAVKSFPANDRLPNVISVAAVDTNGKLAYFSNFGATTVDIAAPGVNIRSTVPGGYATYSGTSMAAPYVSGVVALVVGLHPELSAQALVRRVLNAAKPLAGLKGKVITGGIVDAAFSVSDAFAAAHPGVKVANHKVKKPVAHAVQKTPKPKPAKKPKAKSLSIEVD